MKKSYEKYAALICSIHVGAVVFFILQTIYLMVRYFIIPDPFSWMAVGFSCLAVVMHAVGAQIAFMVYLPKGRQQQSDWIEGQLQEMYPDVGILCRGNDNLFIGVFYYKKRDCPSEADLLANVRKLFSRTIFLFDTKINVAMIDISQHPKVKLPWQQFGF